MKIIRNILINISCLKNIYQDYIYSFFYSPFDIYKILNNWYK